MLKIKINMIAVILFNILMPIKINNASFNTVKNNAKKLKHLSKKCVELSEKINKTITHTITNPKLT